MPETEPRPGARMVDVSTLLKKYPNRPVVMFPECTTTNGRGILPLSYSLLNVPPNTKIFPISLRYTPMDAVTPLPGSYLSFLWNLLGKPTHCIRARIAECVISGSNGYASGGSASRTSALEQNRKVGIGEENLSAPEKALLDYVGESLARLGRVRRVGLGVQEKKDFVRMWSRTRRTW